LATVLHIKLASNYLQIMNLTLKFTKNLLMGLRFVENLPAYLKF